MDVALLGPFSRSLGNICQMYYLVWRFSVKALLLVLLGLVLLTSLVGISYATPTLEPTQNSSSYDNSCYPHHNANNMMMGCGCGAHSGGGNGKGHP